MNILIFFSEISSDFRIWETVYFHQMPSHRSIVEWHKDTALHPILEQLSDSDKEEFEQDIFAETKKYILFRKTDRLFFTARRL